MTKMHTKELFIEKARKRYGDKFDYSEAVYRGNHKNIVIICKKHGKFKQTPNDHLHNKYGCPECAKEAKYDELVCGIGFNDAHLVSNSKVYKVWFSMLRRCYKSKQSSYAGCEVCQEWLKSSCFQNWFNANYIEGYALDKDIILKGNKLYCPEFCCFVPQRINNLLTKDNVGRGQLPIGVTIRKGEHTYLAVLNIDKGVRKKIGRYPTPEEAFLAYKEAKESYIKEVAQDYYNSGKISKRVYDALLRYEVEITD